MGVLRMLISPISLRFHDTEAMKQALWVLEKSKASDEDVPRWMRNFAKKAIARELIRRNEFFWES